VPRDHHSAFGEDAFGRWAERAARFFGTPQYIVGQSVLVVLWIALNAAAASLAWDPYPFILLNLAFSTQAAYAAPLILLAQTRQADRDRVREEAEERHRETLSQSARRREEAIERMATELRKLLEQNTELTREIGEQLRRRN
jgi:uncharacterized membrane protein